MKSQSLKIVVVSIFCILLSIDSNAALVSGVEFGVDDIKSKRLIERLNYLSQLRSSGRYEVLSEFLSTELTKKAHSKFGRQRVLFELADLYSYQLLDLEMAIEADAKLLSETIEDKDESYDFIPQYQIANERILADLEYLNQFANIDANSVREISQARLDVNKSLLSGNLTLNNSSYDKSFLLNHLNLAKNDLASVKMGSKKYFSLVSRLFRAEYELVKLDNQFKPIEFARIKDGSLNLRQVDLAEINYLQLANYLSLANKQTKDITYAEMALETLYRPYLNIRNPVSRWQYNKLINDYISILINANFEAKRYDEMLYYVSLNKSRMLLEERLAFAGDKNANQKISELTATDGIPRTAYGLPEKKWFMQQLANTDSYLDFYVGGKYVVASAISAKSNSDKSSMPLNSRNIGLKDSQVAQVENFEDDALIVTEVNQGKVSAKKIAGNELAKIKNDLEQTYQSISNSESNVRVNQNPFLTQFNHQKKLTVSPDKWVSKHPLDFHLGTQITRSVNFFTAGNVNQIKQLKVAGFFNPTSDLAGAEQEADVIQSLVPDAQLVKRESANLSALKAATNASVIHLSMHGAFNSDDPKNSKLFFAGAKKVVEEIGDPNALYASEMGQYKALQDRDLIFAAACQTGLSKADTANQNELMGIVRPLTANRNKNIILSLWNVSDAATKDFVSAFYQKLANTKNVEESFHYAQNEIKTKYKSPYYWAAFYLSQSK